ncbi:MAG: AbrB/MazE/SpoVT family DNA-binding domain-containing protein [Candidatus Methylacidiphilaceae bacterium]
MSVAPVPGGTSQPNGIPAVSSPIPKKTSASEKPKGEQIAAEANPSFWTTHLSTKGQVVIPEQIRKEFGFRAGDEFVVVAEDDLVFLKRL